MNLGITPDSDASIVITDITTNNVSTSKHGFMTKAPNDATQYFDGTAVWTTGAWATWSPTFTNLASGTLNWAKYKQIGKTTFFRLKYTMGGANVSGAIQFTPPTTLSSDYGGSDVIEASVQMLDASTGNPFAGAVIWSTSTKLEVRCWDVSTFVKQNVTSSNNPMTWAINDYLEIHGCYETA